MSLFLKPPVQLRVIFIAKAEMLQGTRISEPSVPTRTAECLVQDRSLALLFQAQRMKEIIE